MNYARALLVALVAALLLAPPALAAKGFQLGVTPGEVTSSSAVLWGKATKSGKYSLEVARNGKFKGKTTQSVAAKKGHDNTLQKRVKGLRPNTKLLVPIRRQAQSTDSAASSLRPQTMQRP